MYSNFVSIRRLIEKSNLQSDPRTTKDIEFLNEQYTSKYCENFMQRKGYGTIKCLDASDAMLEDGETNIIHLANLMFLNLAINEFSTPTSLTSHLSKLIYLDLSQNRLLSLGTSQFWSNFKYLQYLNVANNNITTFDDFNCLQGNTYLTQLDMHGNPVCKNAALQIFVASNLTQIIIYNNNLNSGLLASNFAQNYINSQFYQIKFDEQCVFCTDFQIILQKHLFHLRQILKFQAQTCPVTIIQRYIRGFRTRQFLLNSTLNYNEKILVIQKIFKMLIIRRVYKPIYSQKMKNKVWAQTIIKNAWRNYKIWKLKVIIVATKIKMSNAALTIINKMKKYNHERRKLSNLCKINSSQMQQPKLQKGLRNMSSFLMAQTQETSDFKLEILIAKDMSTEETAKILIQNLIQQLNQEICLRLIQSGVSVKPITQATISFKQTNIQFITRTDSNIIVAQRNYKTYRQATEQMWLEMDKQFVKVNSKLRKYLKQSTDQLPGSIRHQIWSNLGQMELPNQTVKSHHILAEHSLNPFFIMCTINHKEIAASIYYSALYQIL
ncbi:Leucine-rich_repeat-containing protein [Hexamita inflata]|uniref:Leucine-rich repeat-containing protein n=1 Tax=Hexamita inflata TaxID=28002 RepID=A0AA86PLB2_9EUKA|nr:Leucine-rich repeat-containing protein [Hexamita inflata]